MGFPHISFIRETAVTTKRTARLNGDDDNDDVCEQDDDTEKGDRFT